MKKDRSFVYIISIFVLVSVLACSTGSAATQPAPEAKGQPKPTSTQPAASATPAATDTPAPTATATEPPTATPQTVMVAQSPVAIQPITVESASKMELLTRIDAGTTSDVLAFSGDGNMLAMGLAKEAFWKELLGSDNVLVWNLSEGKMAHTIELPGTLTSFAFDNDTLKLAACTNGVWYGCMGSQLFEWQAANPTLVSKGQVDGLLYVFPPKDMPMVLHLSTSTYDNYELWDLTNGSHSKLYHIIQTTEWDAAMSHSADGEHFAIGIGPVLKLYSTSSDQPVVLEDPQDKNQKRYTAILFSPDGSMLASGNGRGQIKLWKVSDQTVLRTLSGHIEMIDTMAFSADGTMLATISSDNTLMVWNTADGSVLFSTTGVCGGSGYKAARCSVAFSPTGTLIATVGWPDKNILLWGIK